MKKFIVALLATVMVVGMVGCASNNAGNNNGDNNGNNGNNGNNAGNQVEAETFDAATESGLLANAFMKEIANSTDIEAVANKLAEADADNGSFMVVPVEEGYLNGFSEEIHGFKSAVVMAPMIGSIPFVAYIFEVDDAASFKDTITAVADPRWNICTEAKETVCAVSGNYVFFAMCPGPDEF